MSEHQSRLIWRFDAVRARVWARVKVFVTKRLNSLLIMIVNVGGFVVVSDDGYANQSRLGRG
jgi:hypothetical protein